MRQWIKFLLVGIFMFIGMILFIGYAFQHPEKSFIGGNVVAYIVYTIYLIVMNSMFILAKIKKNS